MPRSQCEKDNVQLVQELAEVDGPFESPINLNFRDLVKLELPSLVWNKPDAVPKKMKITNTGHTVIISGKWKSERPYLTGGPLDGKYVFSQIHFHWGPDNGKGSEHQVCGESFPLEMHVAHFKTEYMTQESALREKDGMVVLVYLFKLQEEPNNSLKKILNTLPNIKQANSSQQLECRSILTLCNPFTDDYFMYWGSVVTSTCAHILLWIVCREPFGISKDQMEVFRKLLDSSQNPIRRNNREPQPLHKRNVFHVNASRHIDEPMLPIKQIMGCFCNSPADDPNQMNKSGDGACGCDESSNRPQEELEGKEDAATMQDVNTGGRSNGVYLQQTVYFQHSTVHSVPTLPKRFTDEIQEEMSKNETEAKETEGEANTNPISQSCCILSMGEETSLSDEERPRDRGRQRKKRPYDSVTTLANLIDTLETLKNQTYKKLKEIESINHEIRGMKSSCENLEERHWLRHAEKIMSRQKRFTIRSSQCCFSELKKLAKECNFDKLLDDTLLSSADDGKSFFLGTEDNNTDNALVCSNASGDRVPFPGFDKLDSAPFHFYNQERFSRKAQKLIRSFFEDIKGSEETQLNLEKNLLVKKYQKMSKKSLTSEQSNASSLNAPPMQMYITKNMLNLGQIRDQFFTEVPAEPEPEQKSAVVAPAEKKKKSFFKISLNGFENEKTGAGTGKLGGGKKALFSNSALTWLNNRINRIASSGPVIPLRITDIELKSGNISASLRRKSKQSMKSAKPGKSPSDEHVRTEVSSYLSESIISEFSERQSKFSKQSRTEATSIIQGMRRNAAETRRKSELSIMRIVKELDANSFFVHLGTANSGNLSSDTSSDSERNKDAKFIKRRSRRDLWENGSSTLSGLRKEQSSKNEVFMVENYFGQTHDVRCISTVNSTTENVRQTRIATSSESSVLPRKGARQEMLDATLLSHAKSKTDAGASRDIGIEAADDKSVDSPIRKKLKLEWKCENFDVPPRDGGATEVRTISYIETDLDYVEDECQADLNRTPTSITTVTEICHIVPADSESPIGAVDRSRDAASRRTSEENVRATPTKAADRVDAATVAAIETQTERDEVVVREAKKDPMTMKDMSVEANLVLPSVPEVASEKGESEAGKSTAEAKRRGVRGSESEASEISVSPRRTSDSETDHSKRFSFEIERTVILNNVGETCWVPEERAFSRKSVPETIKEAAGHVAGVDADVAKPGDLLSKSESATEKRKSERSHSLFFGNSARIVGADGEANANEKKADGDGDEDDEDDDDDDDDDGDGDAPREYKSLYTVEEINKNESRDASQNDVSDGNEYDVQSDSNGTTNYNRQKDAASRDTSPSLPSTDEDKRRRPAMELVPSMYRVHPQHKPLSAESLSSSLKYSYEKKQRKRRQCLKKKSKHMIKKNSAMMKKLNKFGGSCLDLTNLTEEEQLKIISANVARFVKQKLVEHRQFFDFDKNEPMKLDVEEWSKGVGKTEEEPEPETKIVLVEDEMEESETVEERTIPVVSEREEGTLTEREERETGVEEEEEEEEEEVEVTVAESAADETSEVPETKELTSEKEATGAESEKEKSETGKQTLDFIKLNKMLAGKYKRRTPQAPPKRAPKGRVKATKKEAKPEDKAEDAVSAREEPKTEATPAKTESQPSPQPQPQPQPPPQPPPPSSSSPAAKTPSKIPAKTAQKGPQSPVWREKQPRAPSAETPKRGGSLQRNAKPATPASAPPGAPRPAGHPPSTPPDTSTSKFVRPGTRSASAAPPGRKPGGMSKATPTPPLTVQKPKQQQQQPPKKRLVPTYTLTSYLSTPNEVLDFQQRELDKYLSQSDIKDFFAEESKSKKYRRSGKMKNAETLSKRNLDYLIMLQKRINHEISANIENSMNYVKTLLSQDYNGTAIIEKAPVKNSLDVFDPTNAGIILIEMNDQYDCSSSSSDYSEESGFYCIYQQGRNRRERNRSLKREIIVKRNESGDSGLVDSGIYEGVRGDVAADPYNREMSLVLSPKIRDDFRDGDLRIDELDKGNVSDMLEKYIYHLGGGEESSGYVDESAILEEKFANRPQPKKRKERILDIPKEMKRKLLDLLEDEMKCHADSQSATPSIVEATDGVAALPAPEPPPPRPAADDPGEPARMENVEFISKISEMVKQYLDEYDRNQSGDGGPRRRRRHRSSSSSNGDRMREADADDRAGGDPLPEGTDNANP